VTHVNVKRLDADQLVLLHEIERSEHVDIQYAVVDGQLRERPVIMAEIPSWSAGTGPHSIGEHIDFCGSVLARGALLLGAFDDEAKVMGLAVVHPTFEPDLAWLAFLHVSRPHRRQGAASALWGAAADIAVDAGARSMYVSATSTGSAVGFYRSRGCRLADPVHPVLFEKEPEDIHFVCPFG
jgi:ribosomal protein S18 acetylase RimI-like enzyme